MTNNDPSLEKGGKSGQAIIEFAVGLVAVLVLIAGLLQIASLSAARTEAMVEARRNADSMAMLGIDVYEPSPFISSWQAGPDRKEYTRDDEFTVGDVPGFQSTIVLRAVSDPSEWDIMAAFPRNDVSALRGAGVSPIFGLVKGESSQTFDVLPAFRKLIYDARTITIRARVWMTRTRGIY